MARKVSHVLHDILEAIERVEQITRGKAFADFASSWELRWLVQRAIEIISEASRAIPDESKDTRMRRIGVLLPAIADDPEFQHHLRRLLDHPLTRMMTVEMPVAS